MGVIQVLIDNWTMIAALIGVFFVTGWSRSKSRTSVHAKDNSLDDVGLTLVSTIGTTDGRTHADGRRELRPPLGYRVIFPGIVLVFILTTDYRYWMSEVGLSDPTLQTYAIWGFWAVFGYSLFQLNVRQRVIYGHGLISVWGVDLRRQDRDLTQLTDIRMHEKRPALVLSFGDGTRLYVPKHLTGRSQFVEEMEAAVAQNRARGVQPVAQGFMARAGF